MVEFLTKAWGRLCEVKSKSCLWHCTTIHDTPKQSATMPKRGVKGEGQIMIQVRHFKAALTVWLSLIVSPASHAANSVDLASKLKWKCEGDLAVRLNAYSGHLWILVKSRKIDEKLPFHSCNSSHCDWGNNEGAKQCQVAPCAQIMATENGEQLRIRLKNFEGSCTR